MELFTDSFIAGEWCPASDHLAVLDPATGAEFASVARAGIADCLDAVEAAAKAFSAWSTTPARERSEVLRRAFELMRADIDTIAELIVRENGKVLADARAEAAYATEFFRWFSEEAVRINGEYRTAPAGDKQIVVAREPMGVALLVTPWNFPAAMATRKIAPALAAGCTVVVKPASETPLTALRIAHLLERAGVPAGVVNVVVPSPAGEAVAAMMAHSAVQTLSFTGSTEVGEILLAQAAPRILRCSLELGGNAPFVVYDDADLDAAVAGAMVAKMRNGGAACTAANRFYVQSGIVAAFTERFAAAMSALRLDEGTAPGAELGPMVSAAERDRVAGLVDATLGNGVRLVTGGEPPARPGYYYAATVLDRVSPSDPILATEIFGPVAPIVEFGSDNEVIDMCNDTDRGLISYVYTRDVGKGMRTAHALQAGMVALNRGIVSDPAAPFGGVKKSGIGREGGFDGVGEFLETKYIAVQW